jgi:hypothetical protein
LTGTQSREDQLGLKLPSASSFLAWWLLPVPALHFVKERNGRAHYVDALLRQEPAKPRVAHRSAKPVACAVVEIFRHRRTKRVAVEEHRRTSASAKPAP